MCAARTVAKEKKEAVNWRQEMGLNDDPGKGTTKYLHINDLYPDPEKPSLFMNYAKWLSAFPATQNPLNEDKLSKDLGFDHDDQGNELRRLICLGALSPDELDEDESERIEKLLKDNKRWKTINDCFKEYQNMRSDYFAKSAGIA